MPDEININAITSRIEQSVIDILQANNDNSWLKWSEYVPKAIDGLSEDIDRINSSRENILVEMAALKGSVDRVEKSIAVIALEIKATQKSAEEYRENVIAPLRIRVAIMSAVSGFVGGLAATIIALILKSSLRA